MDEVPDAGTSGTAPKRARLECLIHSPCQKEDSALVSPKDIGSWKTLLRAAEIRQHAPILNLAKDLPDDAIPHVTYHRQCRSIFTMKKDLDVITTKEKQMNMPTSGGSRKSARPMPHQSRVYEAKCIFCEKTNKYLKGQKTRDILTQCCELGSDDKIRRAAVRKLDNKILAIVSRDLVAAEGHYHRSCYRLYTKDADTVPASSVPDGDNIANTDDAGVRYDIAEKRSYSQLFSYIRDELFVNPAVVTLTELTARLVSGMNVLGVSQVKPSTKKHIRRKLESEFGEALHIIPNDTGRLLLYPDNLSLSELAKSYQALQTELRIMKSTNTEDSISKVALKMRDDVKNQDNIQTWPPQISEQLHNDVIPTSVTTFLLTLLTGSTEYKQPSQRVERLCNSFGQDLVYAITCGKTKPTKHIILPFAVKSLTGNVELIKTLNRLGVSYFQVEEIDTALCLQKLSLSEGSVALPRNIHPGVFTTLAWDNIDQLEETLSGEGTSHRVNGIAVQSKVSNPQPLRPMPVLEKTKKRSIIADPLLLHTYNTGERAGPQPTQALEVDTTSVIQQSMKKNRVWQLARMSDREEVQTVSSWTGFNIQVRDEVAVVEDSVGYLPTINAPATHMSTVNEVLNQSINIMQTLELNKIVCVFDQALYAKAAEVKWKHQQKFKNIIIRMGVFHTICCLMSIIGKRFQDAGLRDLCVESGVIADGSVAGVMEGRKYNRAVRLHKLLYEAFMRLAWKGFHQWVADNHLEDLVHLDEAIRVTSSLRDDISQAAFHEVLNNKSCSHILQLFGVYLSYLREENGSLSAFWMSYVDLVELMLGLIRASREGDWILHLASIRQMIGWCFAHDKHNYARYLSYYYATMSRLQIDHPEVYAHFMQGGFAVQIGSKNPFGRIPVDQTIEETVNKDTQTPGGTKGFSLKPGAVSRYYLTSEYRSLYLRHMRDMIGRDSTQQLNHPDLQLSRIKKDEKAITAFVELMEDSWINPLSQDHTDMVSLSTGIVAPPDVASDLLKAQTVGEAAYQAFKMQRLETQPPTVNFHGPIKKQKLKTFQNITRKTGDKAQGKQVVLKADRNLFAHMILIAQTRELHIKDVLAHPLGPLPWSLSNSDGSLRKTNKAALARELEKNVSPAEDMPEPSACIIDGMSLVQKLKGDGKTFQQLADTALSLALHEGARSRRIDIVFDVYWKTSIKNTERINRGATSGTQWKKIAPGHNILQWRKFLSNSENKTSLVQFLVEQWKEPAKREKLQDKWLYVTCGETCYLFTSDHWDEMQALQSTQEEADTRMLLHAQHASDEGYCSVVITAEDTDVLILCLCFSKRMACPLYQKCGTQNRTRYIDIRKLAISLGDEVCQGLVGLHALTGCDTVSAFAGRGKLSALKHLKDNERYQEAFKCLGQAWNVSPELFDKMQDFVCRLYACTSTTSDVNKLRYQLFSAKRGEVESSQLPPCKDCLYMHVLRANYQTAIWRRCLVSQPAVPDPKGCGWNTGDDGSLEIEWMQGSPAPDAILQLISCRCVRVCKLPDCGCLVNQLKCTDMCKLHTCTNQRTEDEDEVAVELDDSDTDEDN